MKYLSLLLIFVVSNLSAFGQKDKIGNTRFVIGVSGPELLHAGFTYRIANASQLGINAGLAPTWGGVWPALSLEHRLYFGKNDQRTNQKTWFFRQGTTFFTEASSPQQFTLNLTVGKDIIFKNINHGITIDAGVFYLPENEESSIILVRSWDLWPALRFELYIQE